MGLERAKRTALKWKRAESNGHARPAPRGFSAFPLQRGPFQREVKPWH